MDNDRRNEIMENLAHETEAPCTQEWRDELTAEELADQGIKPGTIRLSIGTEHIDDIIADLEKGFAAV